MLFVFERWPIANGLRHCDVIANGRFLDLVDSIEDFIINFHELRIESKMSLGTIACILDLHVYEYSDLPGGL